MLSGGRPAVSAEPMRLAVLWARAFAAVGADATDPVAAQALLRELAAMVLGARAEARPMREAGLAVGRALVDAHYTHPESISASVEVLDQVLPASVSGSARAGLYAGLAEGYAQALRDRTQTEQEETFQAVLATYRSGEARFRAVFGNSGLGIAITDRGGRILEINARMADMLGTQTATARGWDIRELKGATDPAGRWAGFEDLLAGRRLHYAIDKEFVRDDGTAIWTRMRANGVRGASGVVELVLAVFEDITERREMNRRLLHQATHDALTGLPNRALLLDRLASLLERAGPADRVGLCFLDLDGFKSVNDTFGHQVGDHLLTAIARRLSETVDPRRHLVARMGGDEFVILVPDSVGTESATDVADAVIAALRKPVVVSGRRFTVSASIGVVERSIAGAQATDLLRDADVTMYWAKGDGKARWSLFDKERHSHQTRRHALAQALPAAIERGELFLEYQPIVALSDGSAHSMEALVRWNHPQRGLLSPGHFVPLAEENGSIVELGRWVLRQAAADAATWPPAPDGRPVPVAVNVAVRQLREPGLRADLDSALADAGLPADRLHLEITESALMSPDDEGRPAIRLLHMLADQGIRIVIDDFGTGYSNLAYLRTLPAHTLKIDSSFVAALATDTENGRRPARAIITGLITLAHACGMAATAEGVETSAQAECVRALGAETAQGFHFSRAVPASQVPAVVGRLLG